uniref:Putative transposon ty3-i gag-pol polyprotein n=1 Tax=Ixodes ricinus TaxID=34613 RepID=A0A6B0ULL6_IXORI
MMSQFFFFGQTNWHAVLPFVTFAYNRAYQFTTGYFPFHSVCGRDALSAFDTIFFAASSSDRSKLLNNFVFRAEEYRLLAHLYASKYHVAKRTLRQAPHPYQSRSWRYRLGLDSSTKP